MPALSGPARSDRRSWRSSRLPAEQARVGASTPGCAGSVTDAANSTVIKLAYRRRARRPHPPSTISRLTNLGDVPPRQRRVRGHLGDILRLSLRLLQTTPSRRHPPGLRLMAGAARALPQQPVGPHPLRAQARRQPPVRQDPQHRQPGAQHNRLNGSIPRALARFPADAFAGNLQLCGTPLPPCSPFFPSPSPAPGMGPSNGKPPKKKKKKVSTAAIVGIIVAAVVVALLLLLAILFCCKRSRRGARADDAKECCLSLMDPINRYPDT
ncbi:hypothetical protein ZWY2020_020767 [Hordeum vulgare]|nr:hypothetical protein ZWY2020_020767 [Hordeum vulgare]